MMFTPSSVASMMSCKVSSLINLNFTLFQVDLIDCEQYIANIVVTAVIEARGPGETGRNSAYIVVLYVVWNTFEGLIHFLVFFL